MIRFIFSVLTGAAFGYVSWFITSSMLLATLVSFTISASLMAWTGILK